MGEHYDQAVFVVNLKNILDIEDWEQDSSKCFVVETNILDKSQDNK